VRQGYFIRKALGAKRRGGDTFHSKLRYATLAIAPINLQDGDEKANI
jgi:hypothetical protein